VYHAIGVGAKSTFWRGQDIFDRKYTYEKLTKCPNFTWYCPKNKKIPEFYMIFARKCPNFSWHLPERYFPDFLGGRHVPPFCPVSYAYISCCCFTSRVHQTIFIRCEVGLHGLGVREVLTPNEMMTPPTKSKSNMRPVRLLYGLTLTLIMTLTLTLSSILTLTLFQTLAHITRQPDAQTH